MSALIKLQRHSTFKVPQGFIDANEASKLSGYPTGTLAAYRNERYREKYGPPFALLDGHRAIYSRRDLAGWLRAQSDRLQAESADKLKRAEAIERAVESGAAR
jgi:hypothetical protein